MSDHGDLADQRDEEADRMEHESERIAEGAEQARAKLRQAHSDELVPEAMGEDDPGASGDAGDDQEDKE